MKPELSLRFLCLTTASSDDLATSGALQMCSRGHVYSRTLRMALQCIQPLVTSNMKAGNPGTVLRFMLQFVSPVHTRYLNSPALLDPNGCPDARLHTFL